MSRFDDKSDRQDIEESYRVFLGRPPESESTFEEKSSLSIRNLISQIISSKEFLEGIYRTLMNRNPDQSERLDQPPPPGSWTWISEIGALDPNIIEKATTWGLLLLEFLVVFSQSVEGSGDFQLDVHALRYSLSLRRASAASASLRGGIDSLNADRLEGWAIDLAMPDRPLELHVYFNDDFVTAIRPDRFRRELQDAHGGMGIYGFSVALPFEYHDNDLSSIRVDLVEAVSRRRLARGILARDVQKRLDELSTIVQLLSEIKQSISRVEDKLPAARATVSFSIRTYDAYQRAHNIPIETKIALQRECVGSWELHPLFLISIIRDNTQINAFARTKSSCEQQTYKNWKWRHENPDLTDEDKAYSFLIRIVAGDELDPIAFFRIAEALHSKLRPLLITVDNDQIDVDVQGNVRFIEPRFRGSYDYWELLQRPDLSELIIVQSGLASDCGISLEHADPSDALRLANAAGPLRVRHLPQVLHHRAPKSKSLVAPSLDFINIVRQEVSRAGVSASVVPHQDVLGAHLPDALVIQPKGTQATLVSVIIPTCDRLDLLRPCVAGLLGTRDANATPFELIIIDNGGKNPDCAAYISGLAADGHAQVLRDRAPFNWAALNNEAVLQSSGDILLFLNDDTIPVTRSWCDELCLWAKWPGVGIVGARLIYRDGTIQHAGVVVGAWGSVAHEGVGAAGDDPGYLGRHALVHRASAITGACMAVRREAFEMLGGFDTDYAIAYNDVDFCLRAESRGWAVLYAPQAVFYHFESKTRRFDDQLEQAGQRARTEEAERLKVSWGARLLNDPFYNPHFERWAPPFSRLAAMATSSVLKPNILPYRG